MSDSHTQKELMTQLSAQTLHDQTASALESVRHKILDLSLRNKLLNYKLTAKHLRIVDEMPNQIFNALVCQEKSLKFKDNDEQLSYDKHLPQTSNDTSHKDNFLQTQLDQEAMEKALRKLSAEAKRAIDETGSNLLYLSIGFLEWFDRDNTENHCLAPLILIPVKLNLKRIKTKHAVRYQYTLKYSNEDLTHNICLAQKLLNDFGIVLPELASDIDRINLEGYFNKVRDAVAHCNNWRISREMILDLFSFSRLFMYLDLDESRWPQNKKLSEHPILNDLLAGTRNSATQAREETQNIPLIYDADNAQLSAIKEVLKGKNVVIEGPPGTGKSQTITNMIATLLYHGKSVLFLAEKMAALNVVRDRLSKAGLGDFVLELHSHRTEKHILHQAIKKRLDKRYKKPKDVNNVFKDRNKAAFNLDEYSKLINERVPSCKQQIFNVFWELERIINEKVPLELINLPQASKVDAIAFEQADALFQQIEKHLDGKRPSDNCWFGFSLLHLTTTNQDEFRQDLSQLKSRLNELQQCFSTMEEMIGGELKKDFKKLELLSHLVKDFLINKTVEFDQELLNKVSDLSRFYRLSELSKHLNAIKKCRKDSQRYLYELDRCDEQQLDDLRRLFDQAENYHLLNSNFKQLQDISTFSNRLQSRIQKLKELISNNGSGIDMPIHLKDLKDLFAFLSFMVDQTPAETELYVCEEIFVSNVLTVLKRAAKDAEKLSKQKSKLAKKVHFSQLESAEHLAMHIANYRQTCERFLPVRFKRYREAKHYFLNILKQRPDDYNKACEILEELQEYLNEHNSFISSPEYTKSLGMLFIGEQSKWDRIELVLEWSDKLKEIVPNELVMESIKYSFPATMDEFRELKSACAFTLSEIDDCGERLQELTNGLDKRYTFSMSDQDSLFSSLDSLANLTNVIDRFKEVCSQRIVYPNAKIRELRAAVKNEYKARNLTELIYQNGAKYRDYLGPYFQHENSDTELLTDLCDWLMKLQQTGLDKSLISWFCQQDSTNRTQKIALEIDHMNNVYEALKQTTTRFEQYGAIQLKDLFHKHEIEVVLERIELCLESMDQVLSWSDYCRLSDDVNRLGFGPIIRAINNGRIHSKHCVANFRFSFFQALIQEILLDQNLLKHYTRERHELILKKFSELDVKSVSYDRHRVISELLKRSIPQGITTGPAGKRTELGLLRRETSKSRRHIPVRDLLNRAGKALKQITPCFMMSPQSVSRFLTPGEIEFDVVIMDEASQLRPEDCLGAIARSSQVVVVGDSKQLPPTNFFQSYNQSSFQELDEESILDDMESILDIFSQSYGSGKRLQWHYRSQHEDLIHFSNKKFYDNSLTVFPSAKYRDKYLGIDFHYINNAIYKNRRNLKEAERIARFVIDHAIKRPKVSLGVVAFNGPQRELLLETIEKESSRTDDAFKAYEQLLNAEEPFFVKNLENVQGDERDVMLLSFTYGPSEDNGKIYQRFGPINGELGWRRLNVLFTRARQKIHVFSSLKSEHIRIKDESSRGLKTFKEYISYVDQMGGLHKQSDPACAEGPFHIAIKQVLRELGYDCDCNVGISGFHVDIAVKSKTNPGQYLLGILSDSTADTNFKSTRDRERLRVDILKKLHWNVHRIITIDWYKNRNREVDRLRKALANLEPTNKDT